ncbi:ABC-type transport system, involved in lipoprotein release, permease component [Paraoerskovia marina]|uniref:ABC-type transport system, involved in lipoprotein release, permease component n=1 Tax=Paraoerskovia marina TaxID=545619 RepID=A0A1H1QI95_9CELL|nr:ABC transporter permease [Paraoerskovia marina]SDS23033.1 ABC-type transport system, involved in lipoprotein release, permease component [Paraoerskovia marina]
MFFTYLRRELRHRRRQTAVVAIGMAVAVALVMVVNSVSTGVSDAQDDVLDSVYGIGTDITVTQTGAPGDRAPGRFEVGAEDGEVGEDGSRAFAQNNVAVERGTASFDDDALTTVAQIDDVAATTGTLTLSSTTFSGEVPDTAALPEGADAGERGPGQGQGAAGGPDGAGGSAFSLDTFSVTGVDPGSDAVGPLTTVSLVDGRALGTDDSAAGDDGTPATVTVLDATYAASADLAVGDTVTVGDEDLEVIGTVGSTTGDGVATGSDAYVTLALAQSLADLDGQLTDVYVQADSATAIDAVAEDISAALPEVTVSTQSDLASSVTGSLASASDLVSTLGLWLSVVVLVAAVGIAILLTVSGVTRRTRELGTLKALGWPGRRVVGQVAGESLVQGLLGGAVGLVLGLVAIAVVNALGITLSGTTGGFAIGGQERTGGGPGTGAAGGGPGAGEAAGGPFGNAVDQAAGAVDVVLHAPVSPTVVAIAIGIAVLGGLLAGIVGGARAARLRPAEALRSVA